MRDLLNFWGFVILERRGVRRGSRDEVRGKSGRDGNFRGRESNLKGSTGRKVGEGKW